MSSCVSGALQVYYVVDKPSGFFWKGGVGYITEDMVRQHLPPPSDDSLILVRGSSGTLHQPLDPCTGVRSMRSPVPYLVLSS